MLTAEQYSVMDFYHKVCRTMFRTAYNGDGKTWILGTPFLQHFYTEFHLDNEIICFSKNRAFQSKFERQQKSASPQIVSKYWFVTNSLHLENQIYEASSFSFIFFAAEFENTFTLN